MRIVVKTSTGQQVELEDIQPDEIVRLSTMRMGRMMHCIVFVDS